MRKKPHRVFSSLVSFALFNTLPSQSSTCSWEVPPSPFPLSVPLPYTSHLTLFSMLLLFFNLISSLFFSPFHSSSLSITPSDHLFPPKLVCFFNPRLSFSPSLCLSHSPFWVCCAVLCWVKTKTLIQVGSGDKYNTIYY